MGQLVIQLLFSVMGVMLLASAVRALITGDFRAAKRIVHGTPSGVDHILRRSRPFAFWLCVATALFFGLVTLWCAWFLV